MALGLLGHLKDISMMVIYDYLARSPRAGSPDSAGHELTVVGLLLGLAGAHRGTMQKDVAKILHIHVPVLLAHRVGLRAHRVLLRANMVSVLTGILLFFVLPMFGSPCKFPA